MWKFPQLVPQVYATCEPGGDGFNLADCTFLGKDTNQTVAEVYSNPSVLINTLVRNFFVIGSFIFLFTLVYVGYRFIISDKGLDEAKTIFKVALIGFGLMFVAYWVVVIFEALTGVAILSPDLGN